MEVDVTILARCQFAFTTAARPRRGVLGDDGRMVGLNTADVGLQIVQTESELVGIEALGAAAELGALELFDDRLQSIDRTVAMLDNGTHVAHRTTQQFDIGRQIVEIELHARLSQPWSILRDWMSA